MKKCLSTGKILLPLVNLLYALNLLENSLVKDLFFPSHCKHVCLLYIFLGGFKVEGGNGDWMVKMPLLGRKGMILTLVQVVVEQGVTFVLFKPRITFI